MFISKLTLTSTDQKDGLVMRLFLAVVLVNIWMKSFEEELSDESQSPSVTIKNPKEKCPDCHRKIAWNNKLSSVKSARTSNYHIKCQNKNKQNGKLGMSFGCLNYKNMPGDYGRKRKIFERYLDENICTVKDNPYKMLQDANDLHTN